MFKDYTISVISDTHGVIDNKIVQNIIGSDVIIHAGDIMSTKILEELNNYSENVIAVAGNNDFPERYESKKDKEIISKLKKVEHIRVADDLVTVEHGDRFGNHPSHIELRAEYPQSKLIIYGHTHYQVCDKTETPWVINPGAAGRTRNNDGGPCFMKIIVNNNLWDIQSYCFK